MQWVNRAGFGAFFVEFVFLHWVGGLFVLCHCLVGFACCGVFFRVMKHRGTFSTFRCCVGTEKLRYLLLRRNSKYISITACLFWLLMHVLEGQFCSKAMGILGISPCFKESGGITCYQWIY